MNLYVRLDQKPRQYKFHHLQANFYVIFAHKVCPLNFSTLQILNEQFYIFFHNLPYLQERMQQRL